MSCVEIVMVGDIGTSFEFAVLESNQDCVNEIVDLTSQTNLVVRFKKPDGSVNNKTAQVFTGGTNGDATDGIVQYITQAGDIDMAGDWQAQVIVDFANGGKYHSSITRFKVREALA